MWKRRKCHALFAAAAVMRKVGGVADIFRQWPYYLDEGRSILVTLEHVWQFGADRVYVHTATARILNFA